MDDDRARIFARVLLEGVFERRAADPETNRELFDVLLTIRNEDGTPRYTIDQITGMFISMMFAGHHTTSGTAAWTMIELDRGGTPRRRATVAREPYVRPLVILSGTGEDKLGWTEREDALIWQDVR